MIINKEFFLDCEDSFCGDSVGGGDGSGRGSRYGGGYGCGVDGNGVVYGDGGVYY